MLYDLVHDRTRLLLLLFFLFFFFFLIDIGKQFLMDYIDLYQIKYTYILLRITVF